MISKKIYLVSSGYPSKKIKYFSPYIKTYYKELSKEYRVVIIAPPVKGIFGVVISNFICIINYLSDLIFLNNNSLWFIHSSIHGFLLPFIVAPKRLVLNFHGVEVFNESKLYQLLIKFFINKIKCKTKVIYPSYSFKKLFDEKFSHKLKVNKYLINYSLGIEIQRKRIKANTNEIKVFYPGNNTYLKGFDTFKEFIKKFPQIKFYCFPNVYSSLKGVYKNIYQLPYFDADDKYKVLSQFNFLFHPSRFESLSLILLEAYSIGINCIVRKLPVFKELSENLKNLIWLDSENINFNFESNNVLDIAKYDKKLLVKKTIRFINDRNF